MPRLIVLAMLLFLAAGPVDAGEKTWIGKTILPKRLGVRFQTSDDKGKPKDLGLLVLTSYRVLDEIGDRVKINQSGKVGWVEKDKVAPLDKAVDYFSGAVKAEPANDDLHERLAVARSLSGKLDDALKDFTALIERNPKKSTHRNNRATVYARLKKYDLAVADYTEAIKLSAKNASYFMNRAIAYSGLKKWDDAIIDCEKALRLRPKWEQPHKTRGLAWLAKEDWHKAKADLAASIAAAQDPLVEAEMRNHYARLLATHPRAEFRDGKLAVEIAMKACELSRFTKIAYVDTLAAAHAEAGDFTQAVRYQKRVLADAEYLRTAGKLLPQRRLDLYLKGMPYRAGK